NLYVLIGGKTREDILCMDEFKKLALNLLIATEDGSKGFHGTVVDLFSMIKRKFDGKGPYYLYSCGPMGMLKDLRRTLPFKKFIAQVSLEARMGCGFGACWGCVVKTRNPNLLYQRVCKEGPVFNLEDIVWD
ncbi:MAG: dihydroorotate dehydrogenase electron transfer subunit, partial [Thermodesulfobacteriota bacterium]